jgi:hypothetical protein
MNDDQKPTYETAHGRITAATKVPMTDAERKRMATVSAVSEQEVLAMVKLAMFPPELERVILLKLGMQLGHLLATGKPIITL